MHTQLLLGPVVVVHMGLYRLPELKLFCVLAVYRVLNVGEIEVEAACISFSFLRAVTEQVAWSGATGATGAGIIPEGPSFAGLQSPHC